MVAAFFGGEGGQKGKQMVLGSLRQEISDSGDASFSCQKARATKQSGA